jgi:hypothetical protein
MTHAGWMRKLFLKNKGQLVQIPALRIISVPTEMYRSKTGSFNGKRQISSVVRRIFSS